MEIRYAELTAALERREKKNGLPSLFLIYGEAFLCEAALERLVDTLGNPEEWQPMNASEVHIRDVLEEVNTYSLLSSGKVVGFLDAKLFEGQNESQMMAEKARKAVERGKIQQGITPFLQYLAARGLDFGKLLGKSRGKKGLPEEEAWMQPLLEACAAKGIQGSATENEADLLSHALERGFPAGHYLVVTLKGVDKRRTLYKKLLEKACFIDCTVPAGNRRQDREARDEVMRTLLVRVLGKAGKTIEPRASAKLMELTGFDLRALSSGLEKLVDFVGEKSAIRLQDVDEVLVRTRQDPIFTFTGAAADRNFGEAMTLLSFLVKDGMHPLQLLSALVNQFRKLLFAKDFLLSENGKAWTRGISYDAFSNRVLPLLLAHEAELSALGTSWGEGGDETGKSLETGIAGNGKNPYPVYQTLLRAERFHGDSLCRVMVTLSEADLRIKSGMDAKQVMESALMRICLKAEG